MFGVVHTTQQSFLDSSLVDSDGGGLSRQTGEVEFWPPAFEGRIMPHLPPLNLQPLDRIAFDLFVSERFRRPNQPIYD